jgi:sugar-specific transcriptional regulator TrmB
MGSKRGDSLLPQEKKILTLTRAGLTVLQAKIYLALVMNGRQTVKSLSEIAKVDRANTYREILSLQKIGLAIKKVDRPSLYEALSLDNAIPLLLAYKKEEFEEIQKEAEDLLKKHQDSPDNLGVKTEDEFIIIPKKNAFRKSSIGNIKSAQISNDTLSNLKRLTQALPHSFESHKIALQNGVRTRIIIEKPQNQRSLSKYIWKLMAYPNFELRYTLTPQKVLGVCFDNKTVCILTDPSADIWNSPVFMTNHRSFVTLFQNYFESQWNSAIPIQKDMSIVQTYE